MSIPVKIGKKDPIYCWVYESDYKKAVEKKGSLEYFIRGQGRKRTKQFEKIEGLPDRWTKLSALQIAKLAEQYSVTLAEEYAGQHTCGIMQRQWTRGYLEMYKRAKHLLKEGDEGLFEMLRCDHMLGIVGIYELDIIGLDKRFGELDPEYLPDECLYKGKACSMHDYVLQKYGQHVVDVINACSKMPDIVKPNTCEPIGKTNTDFVQTIDSRCVKNFIRDHYSKVLNLMEHVCDEFEAWADELDLPRLVREVCSEIESKNLKLEL